MEKPTPLKVARIAQGYTQGEMAEKIGSYQGRYSRIELGRSDPDPDEAARIATVLNIPPGKLFSAPNRFDTDAVVEDILGLRLGERRS